MNSYTKEMLIDYPRTTRLDISIAAEASTKMGKNKFKYRSVQCLQSQ